MTEREKLLANNRFLVSVGPLLLSFSKVTNISRELETEVIPDGGNNWSSSVYLKPRTAPEKIVLERGIQTGISEMGLQMMLGLGNRVNVVTIMVMGQDRSVAKTYYFESGMVTKWEVGELDALGKDILIKKLEISHSGLYEV